MKIEEISRLSSLLYMTRTGTRQELTEAARDMLLRGGAIFTVNPSMLTDAVYNRELYDAIRLGVCIPDGVGIKYALEGLGITTEVIPGVELGEVLLTDGVKFAIVGGKTGRAELAAKNLTERHSGCECVLAEDGYFKDGDAMVKKILNCGADLAFICLGTPRQELFIKKLLTSGGSALYIGLGGSVDIYSGALGRAPRLFRAHSLEWLYRIIRQPRRVVGVGKLARFAYLSGCISKILKKSERDATQII